MYTFYVLLAKQSSDIQVFNAKGQSFTCQFTLVTGQGSTHAAKIYILLPAEEQFKHLLYEANGETAGVCSHYDGRV